MKLQQIDGCSPIFCELCMGEEKIEISPQFQGLDAVEHWIFCQSPELIIFTINKVTFLVDASGKTCCFGKQFQVMEIFAGASTKKEYS